MTNYILQISTFVQCWLLIRFYHQLRYEEIISTLLLLISECWGSDLAITIICIIRPPYIDKVLV